MTQDRPNLHLLRLSVADWHTIAHVLRQRQADRARETLSKDNMRRWKTCRDTAQAIELRIRGLRRIENLEMQLPLALIRQFADLCCDYLQGDVAQRIWRQIDWELLPAEQEVCR